MNLSNRTSVSIIYLGWFLVWSFNQALIIYQTGFSIESALIDALITQATVALAGYVIFISLRTYQAGTRNSIYIFIWSVTLATLSVVTQKQLLLIQFAADIIYLKFIEGTLVLRGTFAWLMISVVGILTYFWVYVKDKQAQEKRNLDTERLAREAELSSLRLQLQPHFLFNSLNSISALVASDPQAARNMVYKLSDFLRGTVRKDIQFVEMEEELSHLALYLEIEKVRFGHRLQTKVTFNDDVKAAKVPLLLLQPVVENAIKFGLYDTVGEIEITVDCQRLDKDLLITVTNPFDADTSGNKKGTGFGLNAVQRRLYLLYAQNNLVQTKQENGIFFTTLRIPQHD